MRYTHALKIYPGAASPQEIFEMIESIRDVCEAMGERPKLEQFTTPDLITVVLVFRRRELAEGTKKIIGKILSKKNGS